MWYDVERDEFYHDSESIQGVIRVDLQPTYTLYGTPQDLELQLTKQRR